MNKLITLTLTLLSILLAPLAGADFAAEFAIPTANSSPGNINAGPDGNLWFVERDGNKIGRITPAGVITEFAIPTASSVPIQITAGSDGNLWFTERDGNKIGRITPAGMITEFAIPTAVSRPLGITAGPDGNLWFGELTGNKIGRITPAGVITEFTVPTPDSGPGGVTVGADGNLWFTESTANKIGRITPAGVITEFVIPTASSGPQGITAGPDGNVWFAEFSVNKIGRITPAGVITEFAIPTPNSGPYQVTAGPDGNLWFTEQFGNKIGRITPAGVITEFVIPTAGSGPRGITAGPDGNLWITESTGNRIRNIQPPTIGTSVDPSTPLSITLIASHSALSQAWQVTTDGTKLFIRAGSSIVSLPVSGGTPAVLYQSVYPTGLAVSGSVLYWIDPNADTATATAIYRGTTSGGAAVKIYSGAATGEPIVDGSGIVSDGTKLFTTDMVQGRVHSMNTDGSGITQLGSRYGGYFDLEHFNTLALSGENLYVADSGQKGNCNCGTTPPQVVRISTAGGTFATLFSGSPFVDLTGIAVGNGTIYLADQGANTIWMLPVTGGTPTALVSGSPFVKIAGLALYNNSLYVTDSGATSGNGAVYKVDLASGWSITGSSSGTVKGLTVNASIQVAPADSGKSGVVYLAANAFGNWFMKDAAGGWSAWTGGDLPAPYFSGTLSSHGFSVIANMDVSLLIGTDLYAGYGLNQNDMLANGKYAKIHTISADKPVVDNVSIDGTIYKSGTSTPVAGATISTSLDSKTATTDAEGRFVLQTGTSAAQTTSYSISISASGYETYTANLAAAHPANQVFYLQPVKPVVDNVSIDGKVYLSGTSTPVAGATISTSLDSTTTTTDAEGRFVLQTGTSAAQTTSYSISISASGYETYTANLAAAHPANQVFYLQPVTKPATIGAKFSIASGYAGAHAAFDGTNYLVALESDTQTAKVAAQLISQTGAKVGPLIAIGVNGGSCCSTVAFDGTNYLVAFEDDQGIKNRPDPFSVRGQLISTAGVALGSPFAMSTAGIWLDGLKFLAYGGGKYLLTYTRLIVPANSDRNDNRYIAGRIISPDGTMGSEFRISSGFGAKSSIGFDGSNFFVTWFEDSLDYEVRGRFVSPAGTLGQEISINASTALSDNPSVVGIDGTNYLVVFHDVVGGGFDVLGQRVSPAGALVGGVITISNDPGTQFATGIVFDGKDYLVTWIDMQNNTNWDIYGRFVGKDGILVGDKFAINTDAGNQMGAVGSYVNGNYFGLVTSGVQMGSGGPTTVGEAYGLFLRR